VRFYLCGTHVRCVAGRLCLYLSAYLAIRLCPCGCVYVARRLRRYAKAARRKQQRWQWQLAHQASTASTAAAAADHDDDDDIDDDS